MPLIEPHIMRFKGIFQYLNLDILHLKLFVFNKSYFAFLLLSDATVLFGLIILLVIGSLTLVALFLLLDSDSDIKAS